MAVAPTYPGVYLEEISNGVRTIAGVPTSIAAFLGRTISGPVNQPVTIFSFADFARTFGGLSPNLPMGYAVNDFYQNGGGQAVIVRLTAAADSASPAGPNANTAIITFDGGLTLIALSPGVWGNSISATIDTNNITDDSAKSFGLLKGDMFNLTISTVQNGKPAPAERYLNVTINPNATLPVGKARLVSAVLQQSQFVNVAADTDWTKVKLPSSLLSVPASKPASGKGGAASTTPDDSGGASGTPATTTGSTPPVAAVSSPAVGGSDGGPLADTDYVPVVVDPSETGSGIYALKTVDIFNILCIPPDTVSADISQNVYTGALNFCEDRRAMLLVDPPMSWSTTPATAANTVVSQFGTDIILSGFAARNAAIFFPRLVEPDPLTKSGTVTMAPCGAVAGVMARTDVQRGVWKSAAGVDASLSGVLGLDVNLTNDENGLLNPLGINCLRSFPPPIGRVVWGARTLRGADQLADDYKYVAVRRLALFIEESLYRGTQWVVFEPNDTPLWSSIRLNVGAFMQNLFVQGAFQGATPAAAYFVKCDSTTTTQNDIDLGIVNVVVGFAPLKPAEFVVLQIQQIAGNVLT